MKAFFLLIVSSFFVAALLSLSIKKDAARPLTPDCYTSCFEGDIRDYAKQEAVTTAFAMLHEEPLQFELQDKKGKMISFKTADGTRGMAYEIKPKKKSKYYLLVIQEWWGLNDHIKQESEKLANDLDDVTVLALDMYDGKVASTRDSAMKYMSGVNNERLEHIINGAIAYAGKDARIFTIGWCFGGMWSLQAGILAGQKGAGTVMYYGRPENNLDKLSRLQADVLGIFGNKDRSPSPEVVDAFVDNMQKVNKTLIVHRYDAGHGFANPSNPNFDKEATKDAYEKTIAFFKERIK